MATFEPYYKSERQRLYKFDNGHGASVVSRQDGLSMAVTTPIAEKSFWLNYRTPFGPPKDGLTEEQVQEHLESVAAYPKEIPK
jgi:hypothetical protein